MYSPHVFHVARNYDPSFVLHNTDQLLYQRAVKVREQYAQRYAQEELASQQSNDGHAYFLEVLRRCLKAIESKINVQAVARSASKAQTGSVTQNTMADLTLEETESEGEDETRAEDGDAEKSAAAQTINEIALKIECDMKAKAGEEVALRKSCLISDMRIVLEELVSVWEDTRKDRSEEGFLDEASATIITEAAIELLRHQELALRTHAQESAVENFDFYLDTDEYFGKTSRTLKMIVIERRQQGSEYFFVVPRPSAQDIATEGLHSSDEHEFLVQCLQEAGLELVSHNQINELQSILTSCRSCATIGAPVGRWRASLRCPCQRPSSTQRPNCTGRSVVKMRYT